MNYYVFRLLSFLLPLYVTPMRLYYTIRADLIGGKDINKAAYYITQKHVLHAGSLADKMLIPPCLAIFCTQLRETTYERDGEDLTTVDKARAEALTSKGYYDVYRPKFQTHDPKVILDLLYHNRNISRKAYNELMNPHHVFYYDNRESCKALKAAPLYMANIKLENRIP